MDILTGRSNGISCLPASTRSVDCLTTVRHPGRILDRQHYLSLEFHCDGRIPPPGLPGEFQLFQNYPNPFNPSTTIAYELPKASIVQLTVYDILGRELKTLVNELKQAGRYEATFNASHLASGVYMYRLKAGSFVETKKLLWLAEACAEWQFTRSSYRPKAKGALPRS